MPRGARRRAAASKPARDDRTPLEVNRDALRALEEQRRRLVAERDELVRAARAGGASWAALAAQAGTSRQALMERHAQQQPATAGADVPLW